MANDETQQKEAAKTASDYDLYAASTDPTTSAIARLGAAKLGGGENAIRDLVMLLQSFAGLENGGVAMSQNLRAGVMRGGIEGITPQGNVGLLSGMDVASQQAAATMQKEMLRTFTNPVTGLANQKAHGLDTAELGRLGGYMFGQGAGTSNGPLMQGEILTQGRIDELRADGVKQKVSTQGRDTSLLEEANNLKVGQLRLSGTANVGKFTDAMEDGAATLKSIKDVFGSAALKDLDDTFQQLLGGSLAEVGPRAARARMMGIKSMGTTFFGGDMQAAGTYSMGNQNGLAMSIGAGMGVDPTTSKEMFGKLAAAVATEMDASGISTARGQVNTAASAANLGIDMNVAGAGEVSAGNQRDLGLITNENTEALALVALKQKRGALMGEKDKGKIDTLLKNMSDARTPQQQDATRAAIESFYQEQTGGVSTGAGIAGGGGMARVLGSLSGKNTRLLMKANLDDKTTRDQNLLRDNVRNDVTLQKGKEGDVDFDADQRETFMMNTANLSNKDFNAVTKAMEEKAPEKRKEQLSKIGLDSKFQEMLEKESDGARFTQFRVQATQYDQMENFEGTDQRKESAEARYRDWIAGNQYSGSKNPDDFSTGLIRGMLGDKPITGNDVIEQAGKLGMRTSDLTMKNEQIEATKENAEKLMKTLGTKGMMREGYNGVGDVMEALQDPQQQMGLISAIAQNGGSYKMKVTDPKLEVSEKNAEALMKHVGPTGMKKLGVDSAAGMLELLKDPEKQKTVIPLLGGTKPADLAWTDPGSAIMQTLDEGQTAEGVKTLEDKASTNLFAHLGAKDPEFKRKKIKEEGKEERDESDEEYQTRLNQRVGAQFRAMEKESYNPKDPKNKWSRMDDFIKKVVSGDKEATSTFAALEKSGALKGATAKAALMTSLDKNANDNDTNKDSKNPELAEAWKEKDANLSKLRDNLLDANNTITSANTTVNAATVNVNGPIKE